MLVLLGDGLGQQNVGRNGSNVTNAKRGDMWVVYVLLCF